MPLPPISLRKETLDLKIIATGRKGRMNVWVLAAIKERGRRSEASRGKGEGELNFG